MSFHAYTALWLQYSADRILLPDPLIFRVTLQDPLLAFDQTFTPSELIFRTQLTESLILTVTPIIFTPDPLIFRVTLQDPLLAYLQTVTPDPLIFRALLQTPLMVMGPVSLTPDPLIFRAIMGRAAVCQLVTDPPLEPSLVFFVAILYSPTLGLLTLPAQSVQGNAQSAGKTEDWAASIPAADAYLAQIVTYAADADSQLIIKQRTAYADGSVCWDTVARAPLVGWDRNRGPEKYTITLRGQSPGIIAPHAHRDLSSVLQENTTIDTTESNSVRVPVDLTVRPGDTVTYGGYLSFVVDRITYVLTPTSRYMQLTSV